MAKFLLALLLLLPLQAQSSPVVAPGDMQLRLDLELLNDSNVTNVPLTAWPITVDDIAMSMRKTDVNSLSGSVQDAYLRTDQFVQSALRSNEWVSSFEVSAALNPRLIRSFENTPRAEGEVKAQFAWSGARFALNLSASGVANPFDGDEIRPDGTYVGLSVGNWMLSAGWQERWWGPGRDGSLVMSSNARPSPGLSIDRKISAPFKTKWLSWIGPWSLSSFMTMLDDDRQIDDALLFGVRGTFRPPNTGLEIGISRTAQWCGENRPCGLDTFLDLLVGNDNRGVNISPDDEPGNQLGGFDIRWRLPKDLPLALYMQWIGEDGRGGGGAIGSWMRQVGVEHWGQIGAGAYRSHIEVTDSMCREGGFGFSDAKPNCAYGHGVYLTGYRYKGKAIGHPMDGDGLSYSFGSTLVQSGGHMWNISLRYMEINRLGPTNPRHTLSPTLQKVFDMQITHMRQTRLGRFHFGLAHRDADSLSEATLESDVSAFLRWSSL
ncbi:MAG: capsule assembly Wzi family protein [Gammaproteobacteria bacterium]|nr:capsule assembly Wzi family protein [Gammaproteobacteria bacterium]